MTEIPRIFAASRLRNAQAGVTGVLVYSGVFFAAAIEGPQQAIAELWARIGVDARHVDVIVFTDETVQERWFADWRAGFAADAPTLARLSAWRERCAPLDEAEREELREMLAASDAV